MLPILRGHQGPLARPIADAVAGCQLMVVTQLLIDGLAIR
jgi:hypothetical protein